LVDEDRLLQLERREKSLWKANAKMRRVYQDVEKLHDCVAFFMEHGPYMNDKILDMLPQDLGGRSQYSDSDLREWNPWWHRDPLPHEVI
jgi:hypothetical protein